jgi:ABC-2 type transport system permease protein
MTWIELKLFLREPVTVIFSFAMPVVLLLVLGEVFGNAPTESFYRGVGPMDFYVPTYVGLGLASIGVLALPVHLAAYRENGVLRRFRASSVPLRIVLAAQVLVMLMIAVAGGSVMVAVASVVYQTQMPDSIAGLAGAYLLSVGAFAALGVFLGSVLPSARAAQAIGLMLFFLMMMLGGAGPPPEVLSPPLRTVGDFLLLTYAARILQDPWLGFSWSGSAVAVTVGTIIAGSSFAVWAYGRR